MNGLSDLELVAQAMAPTTAVSQSAPQHNPNSNSTPAHPLTTNPSAADQPAAAEEDDDAADELGLDLDNLDLSSLTEADRAALQPILDALRAAAGKDEDLDVEGILAQMDAAGDVADQLEERLDRLLATLNADGEALENEDKK